MKNMILQTKENINEDSKKNVKKEKNNNYKNKTKSEVPVWKKIVITLLILALVGVGILSFLLYGPWPKFRDWLITSAMTTMSHQYFATIFYNNEELQKSLDNNKVVETNEITDTSLIADPEDNASDNKIIQYANEYERQILEHDEDEQYKIIEIEGKGYSGYLAAIYNPAKIKTVYTKKIGTSGQYLTTMAKDNNALIAINGGGFVDPNFNSNGANPLGITISGGKVVTSNSYKGAGGLIGFTEENKLVLGKMTLSQAKALKVRDAVTFGPFLIVNGEPNKVLGNGGWGMAPRTAIGQRQDGIVLFLVIDGRTAKKPGADMNDLIEIMENYGAYNAANLDGGTSSVMVVDGKIINDPIDSTGAHKTRFISTGFILEK